MLVIYPMWLTKLFHYKVAFEYIVVFNIIENRVSMARPTWNGELDGCMLDAFLAEYGKGNKREGLFTETTYHNVSKTLSENIRFLYQSDQVRSRMRYMNMKFRKCYLIFAGLDGFSWNLISG